MASRSGKRGGDRILESRHLVGLFLGVVVLCAVFFTLGYVMGRSQYGGSVHAAAASVPRSAPPEETSASTAKGKAAPASRSSSEWDFYTNKKHDRLDPAAPALAPRAPAGNSAPASAGNTSAAGPTVLKPSVRQGTPKMLQGSIVLQVAAVTRASDALAMADALQQKKFPSFIVAPATDNFYRVQVGPFTNDRSAEAAKTALDREGFKAIIKR
jgi:cell division septation protein DedD